MGRSLLFVFLAIGALVAMRPDGKTVAPPTAAITTETSADAPAKPMGNGFGETVIPRSPDGHFYLDARVGAATVHFMVDTGASIVALNKSDAQAAGVQFSQGDFTATGETAGGRIAMRPVTLPSVSVGSLTADNVEAAVVDGDMGVSLLGQSWLRRVGTVTIEGDRMILR
jgi:aspartyl protease family protein